MRSVALGLAIAGVILGTGCSSPDSSAPLTVGAEDRYTYVAGRMKELVDSGKTRDQSFKQATQEWPGEVARRTKYSNDWAYDYKRAEASAEREKFESALQESSQPDRY